MNQKAVLFKNNNPLILWTVLDKAKKEELVNSLISFCIKEHIFVIEEEPLSGVCRQLHQILPCMKSQLVVIDKFPNTSKDFSNYLAPLLKLNSCISFPTFIWVCACMSMFVWWCSSKQKNILERMRGIERKRDRGKKRRRRESECRTEVLDRRQPFISPLSTDGQSFIIREAVSWTYFESRLYSNSIPLH